MPNAQTSQDFHMWISVTANILVVLYLEHMSASASEIMWQQALQQATQEASFSFQGGRNQVGKRA